MSDVTSVHPGLAIVCTYDGVVTDVLRDDLDIGAPLVGQSHAACLFDPGSVQKALGLFLDVKEHGASFGWELNITGPEGPRALSFDAALVGDRIVLAASAAEPEPGRIYDGLSRVINDQINSLRTLNKRNRGGTTATADAADSSARVHHGMFSDMLELNNRLVNAERALARRNAELRRLGAVLAKDLHLAHRVLQCSGEAVVVADAARRITDVNPAYTAITGFTRAEVVGTALQIGVPAQQPQGEPEDVWQRVAAVGSWQGECVGRRRNGEAFPQWMSVSVVPDERGERRHYVIVFSDITRLKDAEERWQRLALHDGLTGLPNRVLFKDRLQQAMARSRRDRSPLVLLFIDLDAFKMVNDSLGHDAGDQLLCQAARRIEGCVRETDSLARLGGDEFTVILPGCAGELEVLNVCDKIVDDLARPFDLGGQVVQIGASIGIARFPSDGDAPDTLIKHADAAMYAAKEAGRATSRFFSAALGERISRQLALRTQIALGLQRGEFTVHLQPEVDLGSGRVVLLEALLRWNHPERGLVLPDQFIPIAEESGQIVELGMFVIRRGLELLRELRSGAWAEARLAVNVSRRQLAAPGLAETIVEELRRAGVPGSALVIEVTESMVMGHMDQAVAVLQALRDAGVGAAIDDFGTGHSSLASLRRLPVEFLKIDRSFIADADVSQESATIIGAICAMARSLGLKTVAEGVERPGQIDELRKVGCDLGQGYCFARPQSLDDLRPALGPSADPLPAAPPA